MWRGTGKYNSVYPVFIQMRFLLPAIFLIVFAGCNNAPLPVKEEFSFPRVIDSLPEADMYMSPHRMGYPLTYILALTKKDSHVIIARGQHPLFNCPECADAYSTNLQLHGGQFTLYVDTLQNLAIDRRSGFPIFPLFADTSGFQHIIDSVKWEVRNEVTLSQHSYVHGYPVFIVNNSTTNAFLRLQDLRIAMIQEAIDSNGVWRPIERWQFATCGNSYSSLLVKPGYVVTAQAIKYTGDYPTNLRLKCLADTTIIYSPSFTGSINYAQFDTIPEWGDGSLQFLDN
jgi:hypothetical protein